MLTNIMTVKAAVGRVVNFKRVQCDAELDELIGVKDYGGILLFKRGPATTMSNIEWLRPVGHKEVAQLFVDLNAARGGQQTEDDLRSFADHLIDLFPTEFTNETEAVELLLAHKPAK
ncbi:hypothetical protein ACN28S_29850 [Cystobacter fuscus]